MPPCKKVLLKKIERTEYLSRMIKSASNKNIAEPQKGWLVNENGEFEIDYFEGDPFPQTITEISSEVQIDDTDDEECQVSSDDEFDDGEDTDDEWLPNSKKKLRD